MIAPLFSALVKTAPQCCVHCWALIQKRRGGPGASLERGTELGGFWSTVLWGVAEGMGWSVWGREAQGRPHHCLQLLKVVLGASALR